MGCFIFDLFTALSVTLWWKDKITTRLPESLMYYFQPNPTPSRKEKPIVDQYKWRLSKLGYQIDPASVLQNGSQYLHGKYYFLLYTLSGLPFSLKYVSRQ